MNPDQLKATLGRLTGHLQLKDKEQERRFQELTQSLAEADLAVEESRLKSSNFSFEKTDLYFEERIPELRRETLDQLARLKSESTEKAKYRLFVRETPLREPLLPHSIPGWAAGARKAFTVGPMVNADGRQFWFDFFLIEKLVALYVQGQAEPVLLFKTRQKGPFVIPQIKVDDKYKLTEGSIWVQARMWTPNAPADAYVGLTIKGGLINLSEQPVVINDQLTVGANTRIEVELELSQPEAENVNEDSAFGADARKMDVCMPDRLHFARQGNTREVLELASGSWTLFGHGLDFNWEGQQSPQYDAQLQRVLFPMEPSADSLQMPSEASPFHNIRGEAEIERSAWALPVATIDVDQPGPASGIGGMFAQAQTGIFNNWSGMKGELSLSNPAILLEPGQILLADQAASGEHARQRLRLWKDELNPDGSLVDLTFAFPNSMFFLSNANGNELLLTFANADFQVDRPAQVDGKPPALHSFRSLLMMAANDQQKLIYLYDDNLIQDKGMLSNEDPIVIERLAFALTNALFKVTEANGCLLFGRLSDDYTEVHEGVLFMTFGLLAYLPTLPDPYAANLKTLLRQVRGDIRVDRATGAQLSHSLNILVWLVCRVKWDNTAEDAVEVSFHFAPLSDQFAGITLGEEKEEEETSSNEGPVDLAQASATINPGLSGIQQGISSVLADELETAGNGEVSTQPVDTLGATAATRSRDQVDDLPDYEAEWEKYTSRFLRSQFALLDVSTNADLYGISFNLQGKRGATAVTTHAPVNNPETAFPIQVKGMDVVSRGQNVKAFTVPQISWEPVFNLTRPEAGSPGDPPVGFNYYPDDGGPTQILNNSADTVVMAPIPNNQFLADNLAEDEDFAAVSFFTLPFGMKALALLQQFYDSGNGNTRRGGMLTLESQLYAQNLAGAIQLRLTAGKAQAKVETDMFAGRTLQLANVLNIGGNQPASPKSTLGHDVTKIYNNEFSPAATPLIIQRGVPLERIDLSGWGASTFSNWLNPNAAIAETSQARFDVFNGRCAHEVIQVKSIMYPWGIQVVRTITLFRVGSGYVYRFDTGWQAESDGRFLFPYFIKQDDGTGAFDSIPKSADFEIHPGVVKGLFQVKDIEGTDEIDRFYGTVVPEYLLNESTGEGTENVGNESKNVELKPVFFNADVEVESPVSGFVEKTYPVFNDQGEQTGEITRKVIPSKKILGFVQIAPRGVPITSDVLKLLVAKHGTIGGPIDCEIDLHGSGQRMRLSRFDFNNSFASDGSSPVFSVAGRGNVLLPKDGAWSMVMHERDTGDVSPVPTDLSIPVIREGALDEDGNLLTNPNAVLLRLADPADILRQPTPDTINYGLLQNTDTQKALFLTPAFEQGVKQLFSKTPPLFADAFRVVNSKGVFPNIGDAETDFGDVISLVKDQAGLDVFENGNLQDLGQNVLKLMDISDTVEGAAQQGYQLLKKAASGDFFELPDTEFELINLGDGNFRIYIEYARKDKGGGTVEKEGGLDFNIDSLANDVAESWKSKMEDIGLVVDLAGIDRLMTVRGKWDSQKGSEASYPQPELVFADELQPIIDILEILQSIQTGDYAGAVGKGLKLAMSNKAASWEYKFEASKEIPVIRFPVPDAVYNDPNCPFKLEAGLKLGAYFNAAVQVSTDGAELKPSAGGFIGFYGRLSVMCVSLSAATIYAIGEVGLDIAADTKLGPSLRMQFGFGAQIVIGLPVAGNVSVLFMVGIEMFVATGILEVTAYMLFQGHAEILGGIVSITITIEAKGTISKKPDRTDMVAQVTFGLDISIFLVINISFSTSWSEDRRLS